MSKLKSQRGMLLGQVVLIALMIGFVAICSAQFAGGQGTEQDPWQVETAEHLNEIRNYLGAVHNDKHFVQTRNIDLGAAPWNEDGGWEPIGSTAAISFQGSYDGGRYVISNLTINRPTGNYQALFGYTVDATIKNVGLKDVNINGSIYVAGFIGRQDGQSLLEQCFVTGDINGSNYVAGLVAYMRDANTFLYDSYSTATINVSNTTTTFYAGGLVASQYGGETRRCYAAGPLYLMGPSSNVGGVIGNVRVAGGTYSHIYWNTDTIFLDRGVGNVANTPGQSTSQMRLNDTYEGFNFANVWHIVNQESYPFLRWEGEEPGIHNIPPLLPPKNPTGIGGNQLVNLSWETPPVEIEIPSGYNVYREGERANDALITQTQYQDTGLDNWKYYNYQITAVYDGEESMPSKSIKVAVFHYANGNGTTDNPYIVTTPEELYGIKFTLSAHYRQVGNIDLGAAPWNEDGGWEPIGSTAAISFQGSYDGGRNVISNLTINRPTGNFQALFGYTVGATIKNVGLKDVNINGASYVAGIIGRQDGQSLLEQCFVTGDINGSNFVAGLVAYMRDATTSVVDSYSTAFIRTTSTSATHYAGGITAYQYGGETKRCYATGRITPAVISANVAAVIGNVRPEGGTYSNIYWNTDTTLMMRGVGNVEETPGQTTAQLLQQATYEGFDFDDRWYIDAGDSYAYLQWEGETAGTHNLPLLPPVNLTGIGAIGAVNLSWMVLNPDIAIPSGYNVYRDGERINDALVEELEYQDTDGRIWFTHIYYVTAVYDDEESKPSVDIRAFSLGRIDGAGTIANPYLIAIEEQLFAIQHYLNSHFRQIADIDIGQAPWNEGEGWEPIGNNVQPFGGSYDGGEFTISGLTINRQAQYQGLFGWVAGAELKNISLEEISFTGGGYRSGALTGVAQNTLVSNCNATGNVTMTVGGSQVSAFIGTSMGGHIKECWTDIEFVSIGGGHNGNLIGTSQGGTIVSNCYTLGSATSVGANILTGFIGTLAAGQISNCYSRVTVVASDEAFEIGGLVGRYLGGSISNSYVTGRITAGDDPRIGGLIAFDFRGDGVLVENSYWNIETTGMEVSAGGEGRATHQMTYPYDLESTYVRWDFEDIWVADIAGTVNNGYPVLFYQPLPPPVVLDTPQVTVDIITLDDIENIRLRWELVEDALSYKIYASTDPYSDNWGDPVRVVGENVTQYSQVVNEEGMKFFYVVASSDPIREGRQGSRETRKIVELRRVLTEEDSSVLDNRLDILGNVID